MQQEEYQVVERIPTVEDYLAFAKRSAGVRIPTFLLFPKKALHNLSHFVA